MLSEPELVIAEFELVMVSGGAAGEVGLIMCRRPESELINI